MNGNLGDYMKIKQNKIKDKTKLRRILRKKYKEIKLLAKDHDISKNRYQYGFIYFYDNRTWEISEGKVDNWPPNECKIAYAIFDMMPWRVECSINTYITDRFKYIELLLDDI